MTVLTLNLWGQNGPAKRFSLAVEGIRQLPPDIVCLQETPVQVYESLAYPARRISPDSGLAILSRFALVDSEVITYRVVSPFEPYRRQAILAKLKLNSLTLWVVTTHLAWKREDTVTRLAQVEELLNQVDPLGPFVLLAGDFNSSPEQIPIQRIQEQGFVDLFHRLHPEEPGITWDNRNPFIQQHEVKFPDRRIDYLFLKKEALDRLDPKSCEVIFHVPSPEGLYPSDHYGVLANFQIRYPT